MAMDPIQSPLSAMDQFLDRIRPYDPDPDGGTAMTVELRLGREHAAYQLTEHAASALHEALSRYQDPADRGRCDLCGGPRLDADLACQDCGNVNGVFGAVLLHTADVGRRGRATARIGAEDA